MSEWFQIVVDRDATEQDAPALGHAIRDWLALDGVIAAQATDCVLGSETGFGPGPNYEKAVIEPFEGLLSLRTNGLEIVAKRTVFYCFDGPLELACTACTRRFEPSSEWHTAIEDWYEKRGVGLL